MIPDILKWNHPKLWLTCERKCKLTLHVQYLLTPSYNKERLGQVKNNMKQFTWTYLIG